MKNLKKIFAIFLVLMFAFSSFSQDNSGVPDDDRGLAWWPFPSLEQLPYNHQHTSYKRFFLRMTLPLPKWLCGE